MSRHNPELSEVSGGSYARVSTTWAGANTASAAFPAGSLPGVSGLSYGELKIMSHPGMVQGQVMVWNGTAWSPMTLDFGSGAPVLVEPTAPEPTGDEAAVLAARKRRSEAREAPQRRRPSVDPTPRAIER